MPDKRIILLAEGDDDRVVMERLQAAGGISASIEIRRRDTGARGGWSGLLADVADHIDAGTSVVMVRDLDALAPEAVGAWLANGLRSMADERCWGVGDPKPSERSRRLHQLPVTGPNGRVNVVVVGVGLPDDQSLVSTFGLERYALDDYLLHLAAEREVYDQLTEVKDEVPHDRAMSKLLEIKALMDRNRLPLRLSKHVLHLFRGITRFRASPAKFAERLLNAATTTKGVEWVKAIYQPLVEDVEEARLLLACPSVGIH